MRGVSTLMVVLPTSISIELDRFLSNFRLRSKLVQGRACKLRVAFAACRASSRVSPTGSSKGLRIEQMVQPPTAQLYAGPFQKLYVFGHFLAFVAHAAA